MAHSVKRTGSLAEGKSLIIITCMHRTFYAHLTSHDCSQTVSGGRKEAPQPTIPYVYI